MPNERFQFLKVYADSLNEVAKADEQLAKELAWKIIQYGIYDKDIISENPIIEALFINIKIMIDNGKTITEKNKNNWKKWWAPRGNQNAVKHWENDIKQPKNNPETTEKQPKTTKIENRKYKKENNIIITSNDVITEDKSSEEYGDKEINKCLELIKTYNNWIIDGTKKNQRIFWKHLINKLKELDSIKDWRFTWENTLEIILKVISTNKYYSSKISSPEQIYRNLGTLMNVCKNEITKHNASNVLQTL